MERLIGYIDEFVDSLTDVDLKTLTELLHEFTIREGHPRQAVGMLVQGIMFPNLDNCKRDWADISRKRFRNEGRENTWKTLYLLFQTFHRQSFESIESHNNYQTFVSALENLIELRDGDLKSVRTEFKTVLKEVLKCLLPGGSVYRTMVQEGEKKK
jgi:hypothetical protein